VQDKIKYGLIGLAAVIVLMVFVLLQYASSLNKLKGEKDVLLQEKTKVEAELANLSKENRQIKGDFAKVSKDLETVQAQKTEAENSFRALSEEKTKLQSELGKLNVKLLSMQSAPAQPEQPKRFTDEAASSPTADAYWAGILKKKAELELKLEATRGELNNAKLANEQLKRERDKLSMDIQSYETDQSDANREFNYNKKLADNLTVELTREKTDKFQMRETVKALKNENRLLKSQLKVLNERKTRLEDKFSELQDRNASLENNMVKLEAFVREKILQVDDLKSDLGIMPAEGGRANSSADKMEDGSSGSRGSIELAPIVVKSLEEQAASRNQQAAKLVSVIAVNRDDNFVIINLGNSSGVKVGDTFRIFRKDELVGSVEVIQARDNISACDIKNEFMPIVVGDTAK
jgi:chromosome segregation ATPase